ncbi:MAG: hypothetical protein A2X54_02335 [Nitrospirae bacterium GWF2_44_13]|nr:MAG: hypothetical protein US70_C0007G0003 [Parcubacteria group bacterium GW2011_GWD2_38_11]OGW31272.1 MAG: hypothetical protein A2X54_02335 [Nitrospirae bacterium GWF2_44_13]OGW64623.1 MAG: hypothetical protein A2222_04140 [Nitrospirae bacterium RIFOXYA2_FULL_44_9]HBG93210.1 hypothetical protein [Nitrospiraceae bacterium]
MSTPDPAPQNLPNWMIIFAFVASLLLTIFKFLEGIFKAFRKSTLEIVLTREVFFRILETGESLYSNAVLVAHDTGALIKDIQATLTKENGSTKNFVLRVAQIGEKYRTADGLYQFSFHSSSPLTFVPENVPQRQVYICEHLSYAEATRQEFQKFQQKLFKFKERFNNFLDTDDQAVSKQYIADTTSAINDACTNIMDKIQIEPGEYTLTLSVTYRQKLKYIPAFTTKKAESKVQFVVENYARDTMRYSLNEYLRTKLYQFIADKNETITLPEYSPSNVIELSE